MKMASRVGILALASAAVVGCHSDDGTGTEAPPTAQARIVESRLEQAPILVRATGTLHAKETAVLSAQVMGRVRQVLVREGDQVHAGQTLVVLDDAALRAQAEQADAAVKAAAGQEAAAKSSSDLAASTLVRYQQLEAQKSVSPQELDEVTRRAEASTAQADALKAQGAAAQAQAAGARAMLGYTRIHAPFTGVVTARSVDPGAMAAPGVPLLQVDSAGPLQLHATVDESAIGAVRKGMKIAVNVNSAALQGLAGTVAEILPAADAASHTFTVKIDLAPSRNLRAGMYGIAEIPTGTRKAMLVPRTAIVLRGSLPCVYSVDANGIANLRYLTLGAVQGSQVEVLSGISAGEKLVDDPADRELAGKRIEVQP